MKDEIRNELRGYAETVSENCRELARETERLACFVEDLLAYRDLYDTAIDTMDERYQRRGGAYILCEDANLFINAASGAVEVDDRVKTDLRLYEYAKPRLGDAFRRLRYCDEMWFFTLETLACGWVDYNYIGPTIPDGIDLAQIHPMRVTRLDWFAMVNPVNNPARKGAWSPFPFIDLYSQWIFTYHYPLYAGDEFHGAFVPHANIDPMLEDSIYKGAEKMMAIHDDGTLIGMNAAAEKEFELETYKFRPLKEFFSLEDHAAKVTYVRNNLSLMKNKCEDFHWLADGIKWQDEFEMTILGKNYTIVKERVPQLRMNLVALLDKG